MGSSKITVMPLSWKRTKTDPFIIDPLATASSKTDDNSDKSSATTATRNLRLIAAASRHRRIQSRKRRDYTSITDELEQVFLQICFSTMTMHFWRQSSKRKLVSNSKKVLNSLNFHDGGLLQFRLLHNYDLNWSNAPSTYMRLLICTFLRLNLFYRIASWKDFWTSHTSINYTSTCGFFCKLQLFLLLCEDFFFVISKLLSCVWTIQLWYFQVVKVVGLYSLSGPD